MGKAKSEQAGINALSGWAKFVAARDAKAAARNGAKSLRVGVVNLATELSLAAAYIEQAEAKAERDARLLSASGLWDELELFHVTRRGMSTDLDIEETDRHLDIENDSAPLQLSSVVDATWSDGGVATLHAFAYATSKRGVFAIVLKRETVKNHCRTLATAQPHEASDTALRAAVKPLIDACVAEAALQDAAQRERERASRHHARAEAIGASPVRLCWYASTTPASGSCAQLGWTENHGKRTVRIGAESSTSLAMHDKPTVKRFRGQKLPRRFRDATFKSVPSTGARVVQRGDLFLSPYFAPCARKPVTRGPWDLWASVSAIGEELNRKTRKPTPRNGVAIAPPVSLFDYKSTAERDARFNRPALSTPRREREPEACLFPQRPAPRVNFAAFEAYGAAERCAFLALGF